jgi:hypothetical protein
MCSSPTSWKLHNAVTVAVSISAATILVQCIGRHNASSDSTSFPLYCFYTWWSYRTTSCTCLTVLLSTTQLMLQPCMAILILGPVTSMKRLGLEIISLCCMNWRICGTPSETFPVTGKNKLYFTHTWANPFPPLGNLAYYTVFWDANPVAGARWFYTLDWIPFCTNVIILYSLLYRTVQVVFLLYWTSYTAAFNSVQSCYNAFMLCTEFLTECLTLYWMFYTAAFASAENFLHCMHACTEFLTLHSLL